MSRHRKTYRPVRVCFCAVRELSWPSGSALDCQPSGRAIEINPCASVGGVVHRVIDCLRGSPVEPHLVSSKSQRSICDRVVLQYKQIIDGAFRQCFVRNTNWDRKSSDNTLIEMEHTFMVDARFFFSLWLSNAIGSKRTRSSFVQVLACRLFGAKSLTKAMLNW